MPRVLGTREVREIVEQFGQAARNAKAAGFDGVEVHGGNGYFVDQFLRSASNRRADIYGGTIARRLRFLLEVVELLADVWPGRVGVKLTPANSSNGMDDDDQEALFDAAVAALNESRIAYVHLVEPVDALEPRLQGDPRLKHLDTARYRRLFAGRLMANGGYDGPLAGAKIARSEAELVAFGRGFLANPDWPERVRRGGPFNAPDASSFYGGSGRGFSDYPCLDGSVVAP